MDFYSYKYTPNTIELRPKHGFVGFDAFCPGSKMTRPPNIGWKPMDSVKKGRI